jgi:hypothetical protein
VRLSTGRRKEINDITNTGIFLNLAFYRQVFPLLPVNNLHNWLVFLSMPIVAIIVSKILAIIERSITTPKVQIKYCAEALSRINRLMTSLPVISVSFLTWPFIARFSRYCR